MAGTFDFAPNSRASKIAYADEDGNVIKFRGWEFAARSDQPLQRKFEVTLSGMRWYVNGSTLDVTTDIYQNAGRLQRFFESNRMTGSFAFVHEYLGPLTCRFAAPALIPFANPESGGLIDAFTVMLIHANPSYTS